MTVGASTPRGVTARRARVSRQEALFVTALLALSAAAWLAGNRLASPGMRMGVLTGAADRGGSVTVPTPMSLSIAAGLFLLTWLVMMAAMMLPSAMPVILGASRLAGSTSAGTGAGARAATPYVMTAAYLSVWALSGLAAYAAFLGFQVLLPAGNTAAVRVGALVLLAAGIFQFSPLKRMCLRHCRSPLAVLVHYGPAILATRSGAARVGVRHGAYCLGCCWALMAVLLAAGMMSMVWMGVVAAVVLVEKVSPRGELVSRSLGALLIVLAVLVAALPGLLPPLA